MANPRAVLKDERLEVRIPSAAKTLIYLAAQARRQPVSEFMIEQSVAGAETALADRKTFVFEEADWNAFNAILDAPSRNLATLEKAFAQKPVWDK